MTSVYDVDGRDFTFPTGWVVSKFDEWAYYTNQFQSQSPGYKAVDLVAVSPERHLYLIEVKDYLVPGTLKPSELPAAIAKKVVDTLAALVPAAVHANVAGERELADLARRCLAISVVFHCELPKHHIPVVDTADLTQKLKKLVRAIDHHPSVVNSRTIALPWTVSAKRNAAV